MNNFIDELLEELEEKEENLLLAHADLMLKEIGDLQQKIETNFTQSDLEKSIIHDWTLSQNSKLQERISRLEEKLEEFMYEQKDVKTINLCHGKLLRRKQPAKVEIIDMDEFLKNNQLHRFGTNAEVFKPNLTKIKAYLSMCKDDNSVRGVRVVQGVEKFSIKINNQGEEEND